MACPDLQCSCKDRIELGVTINSLSFRSTLTTTSRYTSLVSVAASTTTSIPSIRTTEAKGKIVSDSDGLSQGAKIGIGLGVGIFGVAALSGIVAALLVRRRGRSRSPQRYSVYEWLVRNFGTR
jgi:hypothetical protein